MSSSESSHAHLADSNQGEPGENDDSGAIIGGTQHEIEPLRAPHCPLPPRFPCPWIPHACCLLKVVTFIWLIQVKESLESFTILGTSQKKHTASTRKGNG